MYRIPLKIITIILIAFLAISIDTKPVQSQTFSLFGPPSSGKMMVSLRTKERPGTIIVSFGDRKLYRIHKKGRAISYPIAVPRSISKWEGVLPVSSKRVNPSWTPTVSMRREDPKLPSFVPGGHPRNPLGSELCT